MTKEKGEVGPDRITETKKKGKNIHLEKNPAQSQEIEIRSVPEQDLKVKIEKRRKEQKSN